MSDYEEIENLIREFLQENNKSLDDFPLTNIKITKTPKGVIWQHLGSVS